MKLIFSFFPIQIELLELINKWKIFESYCSNENKLYIKLNGFIDELNLLRNKLELIDNVCKESINNSNILTKTNHQYTSIDSLEIKINYLEV